MEATVKMGHASSAIERRAQREQIEAGDKPYAVTPRGQMNEAIQEKRGLGHYIERGREWLHDMGDRVRERAELAGQSMASLVQGAARTMRARLDRSASHEFDMLPALDQSPGQQQTPALDYSQGERDRQRQRQRGHDRDGPDIGQGR